MRIGFTLCTLAVAALAASQASAATANFSWTQTDFATGSGTITASLGSVSFSMPTPDPTEVNFKDPIPAVVPGGAAGWMTAFAAPNPGTPHGVHWGWSGIPMVTLTSVVGPNTFELDVPLVLHQGGARFYNVNLTDDNGAGNDAISADGNATFAGYYGDDGGGHRHTGDNEAWTAGINVHNTTRSGAMDSFVEGDSVGFTASMTAEFSGAIFIEDIAFSFGLDAPLSGLRVNGQTLGASTQDFDVFVDVQPSGGDVQAGHIGVSGPANNANGVDLGESIVLAGNGLFTLSIDDTNASGADVGGIDWRDRGNGANSGNDLVDLGEDFVKNNGGIIRLTLGNLGVGEYTLTSYHLDPDFDQSEFIQVLVDADGDGTFDLLGGTSADFNVGLASLDTDDMTTSSATVMFELLSAGEVVVIFDGTLAPDTEVPFNGFRLQFEAPVPEPATFSLLGLAGLALLRRRRAA